MFSCNGRESNRLVVDRGTDAGSGGRIPDRRSWRGVSMRLRLLAGLGLAVALVAFLATLAALPAPPLQAESHTTATEVPNGWSLKPVGLGGGDKFRLLFISSTDTDATPTDIADYNTFIQNLAAAGHTDIRAYSAGFRVVGCTADVDARDNTATDTDGAGVPIYWVNGNKVADNNADFYDQSWDEEVNNKDESGTDGPNTSNRSNRPFTGCDHDGTEAFQTSGVSLALGATIVGAGFPNSHDTNHGPLSGGGDENYRMRPMYGLSQVFVVPASVPPSEVTVPHDWGLIPSGLGEGARFRLLLLSSTKTDATSTDISDYNTFIQNLAAAGHADIRAYSAGFRVVGCTADVDARDSTGTDGAGVPIYWVNGNKVADDNTDFYDQSWDDERHDHNKNESGNNGPDTSQTGNFPFTGCNHNGTLSSSPLGNSNVRVGRPDSTDHGPLSSDTNVENDNTRPVYGLSQVFEVAPAPPPVFTVPNNWGLIPPASDLETGDQFRLLFISSTKRNATSTDIADYNTWIQDVAAAGHDDIQDYSAGFRVVGCTADVDARDNTRTNTDIYSDGAGVPIYWVNGNKVADGNTDFYDGSWDEERPNHNKNESGNNGPDTSFVDNHLFTGCGHDGTEAGSGGSSNALGATRVRLGGAIDFVFFYSPLSSLNVDATVTHPMYGLSQVFEVGPPEVLVSNTHLSPSGRISRGVEAQSFETGPNAEGYTVSEVDVWLGDVSRLTTSVSIRENNASDEPGALVATLANPTSLTAESLNTFTAQDVITLDASTTYWITVNEGIAVHDRAVARTTDLNAEVGETGWSIGNGRLGDALGGTWTARSSTLLISIRGAGVGAEFSTNAYLSGLALEVAGGGEPITLTEDSGAYAYTAAVANRTGAVKLTATTHHDGATVVIANDDDPATPGEAELVVGIGSNTLTVTVTAEDAAITLTYTVTVERYTAEILVSNTHLGVGSGTSSSFLAQSFETGANPEGYTVSEVDIRLRRTTGKSTSVRIRENKPNNRPGDPVATLTNPGTLTEDSLNTFTAPAGMTLDRNTTYWISVNEGISSSPQRAEFANELRNGEIREPGWSIGDGYLFRRSAGGSWSSSDSSLLIEIRGIYGVLLPAPRLPAVDDPQAIWLATLTVGNLGSGQHGYDGGQCGRGGLSDTAFTYLGDNTVPTGGTPPYTIELMAYNSASNSLELSLDRRFTQATAENIFLDVGGTLLQFSAAAPTYATHTHTYSWTMTDPSWSAGDEVPVKILVLQEDDGPVDLMAATTLSPHTTPTGWKYETRNLTLEWGEPGSGGTVTGYRVEYQPDPAFQWKTLVANQSGTIYTQSGKLRDVVDYYRVAALRSGESPSYSHIVRVQVPPDTPKVPQQVGYMEADTALCSGVKVAWNRAYTGIGKSGDGAGSGVRARGYQVQYAVDDGKYPHYVVYGQDWSTVTLPNWLNGLKWKAWSGPVEEIESLERRMYSPDLKTVITGLVPGEKYQVRVRGCNDARCGEWTIPQLAQAGRAMANAVAAQPLTASFASAPEAHDGESGFQVRIAFSEDVEITPEDMRDHALLVSGGTVTGAAGVDGRQDLWELTVEPSGTGPVSILTPLGRACTETGALCTADGRSLTDSPAIVVPGPPARQANSPATGAPAISGTAQVGETLTADTSGIADDDGLANVTYSYQWVANDGTTDTDIAGATDSSYTLVADDAGRTVKVRVTFTDDAGNPEALTSAATDEVDFAVQQQGAANTPATGLPTISGTVRVGETLTADTSGIADADGLDNAAFSYQWLADAADIAGATASTYSLVAADAGKAIKVRVSFTDDDGNPESLTSAATNPVEAAPEPPAKPTGLSATVVSHDAVTLTWDDPQDDAITGYVILRRDRAIHPIGTFVTLTGDTGSTDTTYTDDTVEPEKEYVFRIKAINEHGEVSEMSHWLRADTPAVPVPDMPTGLSATVVSHDAVTLAWDDPQDDSVTGYVILRRDRAIHPVGTFVTLTGDTGSAVTTYTDDTVEPDQEYVYRIQAINEHGGVSEMSHWVRGFTPAAPAPGG